MNAKDTPLRSNGAICTVILIGGVSAISLLVTTCRRGDRSDTLKETVLRAIADYARNDQANQERARATFHQLGDSAIPHLERLLQSRNGDQLLAGQALVDIGSDRAFGLLVDALNGQTQLSPREAATFIRMFVESGAISDEKARAHPGLREGVLSYLATERDRLAIRTTVCVQLQEAGRILRELTNHPDYDIRRDAADALRAITGVEVPIVTPEGQFGGKQLNASLLSRRSVNLTPPGPVISAQLAASGSEEPHIVCSSIEQDSTRFTVVDLDGTLQRQVLVPVVMRQFVVVDYAHLDPDSNLPWVVGLASEEPGHRTILTVALDRSGEELWRFPAPCRNFTSIACQYSRAPTPEGVIVFCAKGTNQGVICLGLRGEELWQAPATLFSSVRTDGCVPDAIVGFGGGMGQACLLNGHGVVLARTRASIGTALVRRAALVSSAAEKILVATTRRGADAAPELALYDAGLAEVWARALPERPRYLTSLQADCRQNGLVAVATEDGGLMLVDVEGTLRWQGRVSSDNGESVTVRGLHAWRGDGNTEAWLLVHTEYSISVWRYTHSDE